MFEPIALALYLLACFRVTRLITADTFPFEPVRRAIVRRWPSESDQFGEDAVEFEKDGTPYVRGLPHVRLFQHGDWFYAIRPRKAGELVQCPWCMGVWTSAAIFAVWQWGNPDPVAWLFGIAAGAAAAGLLSAWSDR